MKRLLTILVLAMSSPMILLQPAFAQFGFGGIVFDPKNFAENVLTAARTLRQINNQDQARHLESLPDSIAAEIKERLLTIDELIRTAQGIAYEVDAIEGQYETIYRESYGDNPPPAPVIVQEARMAWQQSRQGYIHALQVQASVVSNVRVDIAQLETVVGQSQAAVGSLQAVQAGNQIAALNAADAGITRRPIPRRSVRAVSSDC